MTRSITRSAAARVFLTLALAALGAAGLSTAGWAEQAHDWQIDMQPPATPVDQHLQTFHNELQIIIFAITVFVLGLLVYVMVRFNARRHPVPSKTEHNAVIEILWTVVPVLILVFIAVPSFKLMYYMDRVPKGAMTIKVTGHQWYWSYAYPAEKIAFNSELVPQKDLKPGQPRLLTVDNPLVVPAHTNIRVLVTSTDVIHSWFIPSFGVQEYAVIGRENHAWFNVDKPGTYYGECNQICGINHSHMAIEVVALSRPDWQKWLVRAKKKFAMAPPQDEAPMRRPTRVAAAVPAGN